MVKNFSNLKTSAMSSKLSTNYLKKNLSLQPSVSASEEQSKAMYWVQKNYDVFKEDFTNMWVITQLFVFDEWTKVAKFVEEIFQVKVIINPLFADKALIKIDSGKLTPGL